MVFIGNTPIQMFVTRNNTATSHQKTNSEMQEAPPSSVMTQKDPIGSHWNIAVKMNAMDMQLTKTMVMMRMMRRFRNKRR
jgi:hypothetical protein